MNALLRERVNYEPLDPHTPVALESALLTFTPVPHVGYDLPHEDADTRRHHDEEHHLHPWRDVAEHFTRGAIRIDHSENKIICQTIPGAPASPKELQRPISLMGGAPSRDQDQPRLRQAQLAAG